MSTEAIIDVTIRDFDGDRDAMIEHIVDRFNVEPNSIPSRHGSFRIVGRRADQLGRTGFLWLVMDAWQDGPAIGGTLYYQLARPELYEGYFVEGEKVVLHAFQAPRRRTEITSRLVRDHGVYRNVRELEEAVHATLEDDFADWWDHMLEMVRSF